MGNTLQKAQETEHRAGQEHQNSDTNFTCEICVEPMLSNRKFKNANSCIHPFCLDCITKYIEVKVEDNTGNIECPSLNCGHVLDPLFCRDMISKSVFERWCDLLCELSVSGLDKCYCPYQDCSVLVLNECSSKVQLTKCPKCKKNFCFQCKIPWHGGYRCSESQQLRDRNDILLGELIEEQRWTRCQRCGHSIEKVGGCRKIRCRCGAEFCHQCGGRAHFGSCKNKCLGDTCCRFVLLFILLSALSAPFVLLFLSSKKLNTD